SNLSCSALASRAAYISPEASPAESSRGIGGMREGILNRWWGAKPAEQKSSPGDRWPAFHGVPAPYIATGTGDSKCRAAPEGPDARPARAGGLCGKRGC